ncbi:MAG: hypothetical protein AAGI37_15335 [Planctomycetota bacterium]
MRFRYWIGLSGILAVALVAAPLVVQRLAPAPQPLPTSIADGLTVSLASKDALSEGTSSLAQPAQAMMQHQTTAPVEADMAEPIEGVRPTDTDTKPEIERESEPLKPAELINAMTDVLLSLERFENRLAEYTPGAATDSEVTPVD